MDEQNLVRACKDGIMVAPEVFDLLSLKAVERNGFKCAATTAYGIFQCVIGSCRDSADAYAKMLACLENMHRSSSLGLIADFQGKYSGVSTSKIVRDAVNMGLMGIIISDAMTGYDKRLTVRPARISASKMTAEIKDAVNVLRGCGTEFLLVIHTFASMADGPDRIISYIDAAAGTNFILMGTPKTAEELSLWPQLHPIHIGIDLRPDNASTHYKSTWDMAALGYQFCTVPGLLTSTGGKMLKDMQYLKGLGFCDQDSMTLRDFDKSLGDGDNAAYSPKIFKIVNGVLTFQGGEVNVR